MSPCDVLSAILQNPQFTWYCNPMPSRPAIDGCSQTLCNCSFFFLFPHLAALQYSAVWWLTEGSDWFSVLLFTQLNTITTLVLPVLGLVTKVCTLLSCLLTCSRDRAVWSCKVCMFWQKLGVCVIDCLCVPVHDFDSSSLMHKNNSIDFRLILKKKVVQLWSYTTTMLCVTALQIVGGGLYH